MADSEPEKHLLELCSAKPGDFNGEKFKTFLHETPDINLEAHDKDGMTALMHCAYHGCNEVCSLLLERGADINSNLHSNGYTALMFATLAGHTDTVKLLLRAGARTSIVNNMGKTAVQLGSFAGQHECVQVIRNFFSISDLEDYTRPQGVKNQPLLLPTLATPLHNLLTTIHIHPVKLLQEMESEPDLLENSRDVCSVLELIGKKLMNVDNDGFCLKVHYLGFLLQQSRESGVKNVMKRLLQFKEDGSAVEVDLFLRDCLRCYPNTQSALLKQLVATLAKVSPGSRPSALSLYISAIVGEKSADGQVDCCSTCGVASMSLKKCSQCKKVYYCNTTCQKLAWTLGNHKRLCKKWREESPKAAES